MILVECPRDAMQGWSHFIPTDVKVNYLNQLLKVGFDILDCGSFVSPKAIPQMADTATVIPQLQLQNDKTKLLTIIANTRGAAEAVTFEQISYFGFPFSISETFQHRNTNKSIAASFEQITAIQNLCVQHNKSLVAYISMGFGNPYGDVFNPDIAMHWFEKLEELGITNIAIADTVGVATPDLIKEIYDAIIPKFKNVNIGAHFHSTATTWEEKIAAAYASGVRSFDTSIRGIGGCPMAKDDLVGNIATENIVTFANKNNIDLGIDQHEFMKSCIMADSVFI